MMHEKEENTPVILIHSPSRKAAEAMATIIEQDTRYNAITDGRGRHDFTLCLGESGPQEKDKAALNINKPSTPSNILRQMDAMIQNQGRNRIDLGGATLDTKARLLQKAGKNIRLTEKECAVLVYLKDNAPNAVSREDLLRDVWGYATGIDTHTIETHIYRLRQKIEDDPTTARLLITGEDGGYGLGCS